MREIIIFTIIVTAGFGAFILFLKLLLKFFPEKPEQIRLTPVVGKWDNKVRTTDDNLERAALAKLPERQAWANKEASRVEHLNTLEAHRKILRDALGNAYRRVVIVSPVMSAIAVKADKLDILVSDAVVRGVEVLIYTDRSFNTGKDGSETPTSREGRAMLEGAGATVFVVERIHNKTLCVDDRVIVEGSFNWLSASRDKNHEHQRKENSTMVIGGDSRWMIADELKAMTRLAA
jgi:phosphatidylserine/phosphatidylglycerophosphate/cardiolipin synthase-like enzyme